MKLELDGSSLRSALRTAGRSLLGALLVLTASARGTAATLRSLCGTVAGWLASGYASAGRRVRSALAAPTTRTLLRRTWRGLVGRRLDVSATAVLIAPLLALGTELWVVEAYGYRRIERWAFGTWTGSDPQVIVFLGVAVLVALAAGFAIGNSGLLPSIVLVGGPIFGIGFARYGLTFRRYGTVGIPDATATALAIALLYGVPIGIAGFALGTIARLAIDRFGRDREPGPIPENA